MVKEWKVNVYVFHDNYGFPSAIERYHDDAAIRFEAMVKNWPGGAWYMTVQEITIKSN